MKLFQVAKIVKVFRIDEAKVVIYLKMGRNNKGGGAADVQGRALQYPDRRDNGGRSG